MSTYNLTPVREEKQIDISDRERKPPARAMWAYLWLHQGVSIEGIAIATGVSARAAERTIRQQLSSGPMPQIRRRVA